ncbi:MAG TPA: 30S ribosomal protein S18 [Ignavibacteria bacterium]|nr:30S ribosomal protein S18 [Ignavibacteria bacterium]
MQTQKNRMRKKIDPIKSRNITFIDYRDTRLLTRFLNEQGKILPSRITGVSSKMQRQITLAIKRARHLALMPFVSEEFRN